MKTITFVIVIKKQLYLNPIHLYLELVELLKKEEPCALATVTQVQGSTPQKPGSSAIFGVKGLLAGTIGGGKTEHQILEIAAGTIKTKTSGYFSFSLNDEIAEPDSVICGGNMHILLDVSPIDHLTEFKSLKESYLNRVPGVLITQANPHPSKGFELKRFWVTRDNVSEISPKVNTEVALEIQRMLEGNTKTAFKEVVLTTSENPESYVFLELVTPLPKLIIAGAGHIGKALAHLGKRLDFEVTVWDDRAEYANTSHVPDATYVLSGDLETALGKTVTDKNTFIVIVTRGHKQDADVLKLFIQSDAAYVGMIGSKKKVKQVRELFLTEGWATPSQWEKIHAPIGLDINSKTVEEIAVSIAAELISERYQLNRKDG